MAAIAIDDQVCTRESFVRKARTSDERREVLLFLAQSLGLVGAAVLLYCLGPALGVALIAGGVATGLLPRPRLSP
jgi:hypothetical protein